MNRFIKDNWRVIAASVGVLGTLPFIPKWVSLLASAVAGLPVAQFVSFF